MPRKKDAGDFCETAAANGSEQGLLPKGSGQEDEANKTWLRGESYPGSREVVLLKVMSRKEGK